MKSFLVKNKKNTLLPLFYLSLIFCYYCIGDYYSTFSFEFNLPKFIISSILVLVIIHLGNKIEDGFLCFVYHVTFCLITAGEAIYYQFSPYSRIESYLALVFFHLFLYITQSIQFKMGNTISSRNNKYFLIAIAVGLFIPYLISNVKYINLSNLLLKNVYETREVFRDVSSGRSFMGYVVPLLSRIVLPFLICESVQQKKYLSVFIYAMMIVFLFLCGALKSILFGLFAIIVFFRGQYERKIKRLYLLLTAILLISSGIYLLYNIPFGIDYLRRLFFVPSVLENIYVNFFDGNPTFMSHSKLTFGLLENKYGESLSLFIGEQVIGSTGLNANIGVFTEGYVSFGFIGIVIISFITAILFQFFKSEAINPKYAGIFFVYIYVMNTAFLHSLLIGHGLLFLIVFSYIFMRSRENETCTLGL